MGPFFGRGEGAVHEALIPGNLAALVQLRQEGAPQLQQDALLLPLPESLRQQVVELPYWLGSSLQGAPVHRMPSKHLRSSVQGRPPFALGLRGGRWDWISFHCRSVRPRHAIATILPAEDRSIANQMEVMK